MNKDNITLDKFESVLDEINIGGEVDLNKLRNYVDFTYEKDVRNPEDDETGVVYIQLTDAKIKLDTITTYDGEEVEYTNALIDSFELLKD